MIENTTFNLMKYTQPVRVGLAVELRLPKKIIKRGKLAVVTESMYVLRFSVHYTELASQHIHMSKKLQRV